MGKCPQYNTELKEQKWNYDPNEKLTNQYLLNNPYLLIDWSATEKEQKSPKHLVFTLKRC